MSWYAHVRDVPALVEMYDAVHAELLRRTGGRVDGLVVHLCRATADGFRVIEVWTDRESCERADREHVGPSSPTWARTAPRRSHPRPPRSSPSGVWSSPGRAWRHDVVTVTGGGTVAAGGRADPTAVARLTALGLGPRPLVRLEEMVADRLGTGRARVRTVHVRDHPYDRPALTTAARHLVSGTAVGGDGRVRDWAFFLKHVRAWHRSTLSAEVPEPLRSRLAPLMPWRTEPDVYRGDLGRRLPRGLRLACARHVADLDDESAVVWLDRVEVRGDRWTVAQYRRAAYLLGRLAAAPSVAPLAEAVPVGRTARRFAEHWLAVTVVPGLVAGLPWRQPQVAATFDGVLRRDILHAAGALPALVEELEAFPTLTAHGDACTDNLLRSRLDDDIVLIDFGFWGTAPVGFDLGQLLLGEVQLGRRPAGALPGLEAACLPAYVRGLRDEGCPVPADRVRRAHAIAMALFHAVPAVSDGLRIPASAPDRSARLENLAAAARFVLDLLRATGGVPAARPSRGA